MQIASEIYGRERAAQVELPRGYDGTRRFPVIVRHDDWEMGDTLERLTREGVMPEAIVVTVDHADRKDELSPELNGAAYARFLTTELVPRLEAEYRTLADPAARVLVGAGPGGLMNFYAAMNAPGGFGKFACLSTSFEDVSERPPAQSGQLLALEARAALPGGIRMYFDYGTKGLDECYAPYHAELGALLRERGWRDGREFRIVRVEGGSHDAVSWRARLGDALRFLAQ